MAAALVVLLACAAIAIDVGMLFAAHLQAQRAADAAALAGAGWLATVPGDTAGARKTAIEYAAKNDILGDSVVVRPGDVTFPQQDKVRVWVYRIAARNDPVPTIFARVLGIGAVDVSAKAAAILWPADAVDCVLPIMLPDRWQELGGNPDFYDPGIDNYVPWLDANGNVNSGYTGYSESDYGMQIVIKKVAGGGGDANPSWYYPFRPPGMAGADDYRNEITGAYCGGPNAIDYGVNDTVTTEPGAMVGPTIQGFTDLINQDPTAVWDPSAGDGKGCVTHGDGVCSGSPRIRPLPLFDPRDAPDAGAKPLTIVNFAGLFVEGIQGNDIVGRFLGYTSVHPAASADSTGAAGLPKVLRLVE